MNELANAIRELIDRHGLSVHDTGRGSPSELASDVIGLVHNSLTGEISTDSEYLCEASEELKKIGNES